MRFDTYYGLGILHESWMDLLHRREGSDHFSQNKVSRHLLSAVNWEPLYGALDWDLLMKYLNFVFFMSKLLPGGQLVIKDSSSNPISIFSVTVSHAISVDSTIQDVQSLCLFIGKHCLPLLFSWLRVPKVNISGKWHVTIRVVLGLDIKLLILFSIKSKYRWYSKMLLHSI